MAVFRESSSERTKDKIPLEHMSMDDDLRFFLEIFYNMEVVDYHCDGFYAGVILDNNRKLKLGVNTEALKKFSIDEQLYILVHEGGHIVFNHMLRGERWVNKEAANIAADAVLNSIINRQYTQLEMPKINGKTIGITLESLYKEKLITDKDLEELKKELNELTTDDVYDILMKNAPKMGMSGNGSGNGSNPTGKASGSGNNKDNNCNPNGESNGNENTLNELDKKRLDSHNGNFNADDLDDETKTQIEELIRQAKSGMYGNKTGNFIRDLMEAVRKNFPFKQILDKTIFKEKYDFFREHRRIKVQDGYLPRRRSEKIKVYAMVDVSGSVYDFTEGFMGYIMALDEFEELILIDTEIKATYKKGDPIPRVVPGGGGTDLNPGFEHWKDIENSNRGFKLNFVCLTDGEIPPLTTGPIRSKVVILTTNEEVNYGSAIKPYLNIKIERGE